MAHGAGASQARTARPFAMQRRLLRLGACRAASTTQHVLRACMQEGKRTVEQHERVIQLLNLSRTHVVHHRSESRLSPCIFLFFAAHIHKYQHVYFFLVMHKNTYKRSVPSPSPTTTNTMYFPFFFGTHTYTHISMFIFVFCVVHIHTYQYGA